MLELKNIVKTYVTGDLTQDALRDVSICFRENEFVSILGQSGSGKTTMLNIIGGLDRYTSGDLVINGVSTRKYKDSDWDFYRNHSIGFVFQSYNLIPHQSVLANVELALTLAGVSRKERRERAVAVLKKVGLGEHIHKKPNQMSGGQMQRVAIARALINDPDILLADEPTGALDSETSVQIMELLKEIAREKLVIMVTHNPELAEAYSTRIVRLLDGRIVDDTDPCTQSEPAKSAMKRRKISMSFATALSLSFNNLRTKLGRTLLTAFAGSIGIIGIALILSLSTGIQDYINGIQRDTLASYPISILREDSSMLSGMADAREEIISASESHGDDAVYSTSRMYAMFNAAFAGEADTNNLEPFKAWLDREMNPDTAQTDLASHISTIQHQYLLNLNTYVQGEDGTWRSTESAAAMQDMMMGGTGELASLMSSRMSTMQAAMSIWTELLPGKAGEPISDLVLDQYELVQGEWPDAADEIVLILDQNNEVTDLVFYALGMMSDEEVMSMFTAAMRGEEIHAEQKRISYEDVLNTRFRLVLNAEYYSKGANGVWNDIRSDEATLQMVIGNGMELRIVGIVRPTGDAMGMGAMGAFGYTSLLTDAVIERTNACAIVQEQLLPENENYDVLTGLPFVMTEELDLSAAEKAEQVTAYFAGLSPVEKTDIYRQIISVPDEAYLMQTVGAYMQQFTTRESMVQLVASTFQLDQEAAVGYLAQYSDEELRSLMAAQLSTLVAERYAQQAELQLQQMMAAATDPTDLFGITGYTAAAAAFDQLIAASEEAALAAYYDQYMPARVSGSTLADTLTLIGSVKAEVPYAINIYAATFEDKQDIDDLIAEYNASASEADQITYTDYVALLMSGVTTMVDAVSYALIGFVSISLVVSSIMIGIITYISVLERTKEIGILRSVGASKKDISRVFNAETIIVGLTAGLIGIGTTLLLNIPISLLIRNLTGIPRIAVLPAGAGVILVIISVLLTMIAGLVPSRLAAKKDPVIALRSE